MLLFGVNQMSKIKDIKVAPAEAVDVNVRLQALGKAIENYFPDHGFMICVFPFGVPGITNYVSNGNRADMITMLRATADRLENNEDNTHG